MEIITGSNYMSMVNNSTILFPEYGKNRKDLEDFVGSLAGDESIVTSSIELIDLVTARFKGSGKLIYSDTGESLETNEVYELRRKLDFDPRGGFDGDDAPTSVLFVEGKTDAKFFKAVYKKLFEFRECREVPRNLKAIERVFRRDNFDLMRKEDSYIAIIPSEGNSGAVTNMKNLLKASRVFEFEIERMGVVMDIDEGKERAVEMIERGLDGMKYETEGKAYLVGETHIIPVLAGLPFRHELIDWEKPTVEDLMLHLMDLEGLFDRMQPAIKAVGRPLKPKEAMYIGLAVYGYWGNLEGFYELFVMRSRFRNIKKVLRDAKMMEALRKIIPSS